MGTMFSLQDFLKDINTNHKETMDKAREGVASGAWDGPPLPLTNEYRVTVDKAEYKASAKGPMQLAITFEINEPSEFAGRKLQEYFQPDPQNEIAQRKLSELIGALGPDLTGLGNDWTVLAARFEGANGVAALRVWGTENDRYGIRWINSDRGQTLKTDLKAPKAPKAKNGPAKSLRPDLQIAKERDTEPFPAVATQATAEDQPAEDSAPAPSQLPGGTRAGGPNLPPGLR